jgi:polyisoprenoid-binding protein YceI
MRKIFSLVGLGLLLWANAGWADSLYTFDCPETSLQGSIPYNVIGKYNAKFEKCHGRIVYDDNKHEVKSVEMDVRADSISSNCQWCDKIVKSSKVLETRVFPVIGYTAKRFEKANDGLLAVGQLRIHGITQENKSRFVLKDNGDGTLDLQGTWLINRKDHHIIWNKVLDHGGVIVGDIITVKWSVVARKV